MKYLISLDTLHINVRYPRVDVFESWYREVKGVDARKLSRGIPSGKFVIRGGSSGYKVSVWSRDIRAYLTDDVDEKRGEGMGMGIWVQMGPKFLIDNPIDCQLKESVGLFLRDIGVKKDWEIRVTRLGWWTH